MKREPKSMDELILQFIEHMDIEKGASQYTVRNYHFYLRRFMTWFRSVQKDVEVEDITLEIVRKYRIYLSKLTNNKDEPISRVTQSYHMIALRSFLKWLTKNDYSVMSPEKIDLPKVRGRRIVFLNRGQVERLLSQPNISTVRGLRDKAILETLFSTGLRVSELVSLNREQIDLERREFGVVGKGGVVRVVFLSKRAVEWIGRYLAKRQDQWSPLFVRSSKKVEDVIQKGEAKRLNVRTVQRIVEKCRVKAHLPYSITPHGIRHSFATDLLSSGAGLREVQEMLGHKNVSTTQIYTHVTNPQLRKVHEKYHSGNKLSASTEDLG